MSLSRREVFLCRCIGCSLVYIGRRLLLFVHWLTSFIRVLVYCFDWFTAFLHVIGLLL